MIWSALSSSLGKTCVLCTSLKTRSPCSLPLCWCLQTDLGFRRRWRWRNSSRKSSWHFSTFCKRTTERTAFWQSWYAKSPHCELCAAGIQKSWRRSKQYTQTLCEPTSPHCTRSCSDQTLSSPCPLTGNASPRPPGDFTPWGMSSINLRHFTSALHIHTHLDGRHTAHTHTFFFVFFFFVGGGKGLV